LDAGIDFLYVLCALASEAPSPPPIALDFLKTPFLMDLLCRGAILENRDKKVFTAESFSTALDIRTFCAEARFHEARL
jgi:hypothetical protein